MNRELIETENINNLIERCIYNTPLILLIINNEDIINKINNILPYSTGIEIECNMLNNFDKKYFELIPNIIDVNCDSREQRFRIPNGINGMICLYNICNQLKINSELNYGSGIHYHIDTTGFNDKIYKKLQENSEYILNELDNWKYKGNYNKRKIEEGNSWIRQQLVFQTIEFRIGEMSFDYNLLIKRIIHCQKIIKNLVNNYNIIDNIKFNKLDKEYLIEYFKNNDINEIKYLQNKNELKEYKELLENFKSKKELFINSNDNNNDIKNLIKNRLIND